VSTSSRCLTGGERLSFMLSGQAIGVACIRRLSRSFVETKPADPARR